MNFVLKPWHHLPFLAPGTGLRRRRPSPMEDSCAAGARGGGDRPSPSLSEGHSQGTCARWGSEGRCVIQGCGRGRCKHPPLAISIICWESLGYRLTKKYYEVGISLLTLPIRNLRFREVI